MSLFPSRLSLPFDFGEVLLTPQWPGLNPVLRFGLIAIVCIVPIVLILWLYRWELRVVPRITALGLLGLRMLVLVLLLTLVCLQPVLAHDKTFALPGRVLLVVDRSESMEVTDPQRSPAEKLRLARALNLAEGLATDEQLDNWAEEYERKHSAQLLTDEEMKLDRMKRRELETQRKEARDRIFAKVDTMTRGSVARRMLSPEGVGLLRLLQQNHSVEVLGFHQEVWDVRADQLDELFAAKPAAEGDPGGVNASSFTDIRKPLLRAMEMAGPGQGKVLGVILLTDGQHNLDESPVKKAAEMGDRGLPIYPVALGARKPPPDAALISVKAPPSIFREVDLNVEVRFKVSGMTAQDFNVRLLSGSDKTELDRHIYRHNGRDQERTETFKIRLDKTGTHTLVARVDPADPRVRETRTDNNSRSVVVNVADEKAKVLLVDGEARWEYHYLATALKRDRRMQLQTVVFNQPRLQDRDAEEARELGLPRQQLPVGQDALAEFDCIILGDVAPDQLPLADRVRLEKYVSDRGGTLVILAGKRAMPLAFPDATGNETDPIRKLLPIEAPRVANMPEGFPVSLTEEGRETTFMRLGAESGSVDDIWSHLPKHYWSVIGRVKPGAMSLAFISEAVPDGGAGGEREREQGLIVRQNYGFGRVLFVGLDSTWRWRYRTGDLYHHTFWGDAIHWAAADKALGAGNDYVRFGTAKPVYRRGERPEVVVRFGEELGPIKADLLAGARILRPTGKDNSEEAVALVPLNRRPARPRVLEGQAPALPPGQYTLELVIPELESKLKLLPPAAGAPPGAQSAGRLRTTFSVLPPDSTELIDLETKWTLLEELASKSGGKVFTPENAGELASLLAKQSVPYVEHFEQRLWQWWVVLVLVVSLLTLEWVGRKLAGLP